MKMINNSSLERMVLICAKDGREGYPHITGMLTNHHLNVTAMLLATRTGIVTGR